MNTLERLLNADNTKFQPRVEKFTIFVSKLGEELEFTVRELSTEKYQKLAECAVGFDMDGNIKQNMYDFRVSLIYNSCKDIFCNDSLMAKFNCAEPQELVGKILTGSEIEKLAEEVARLSEHATTELEKEGDEVNFPEKVNLQK